MRTVRWSDIRAKHVEAIGREGVERGTSRLVSQVRARRLADMRKRHASGEAHRPRVPDERF